MSNEARAVPLHDARGEMRAYLDKLIRVVGHTEPVEIAVIAAADMPARAGITDNPDGFLHIVPGKAPLIVLRDNLEATRWQSVVAHELLHVLRWKMDSWVLDRLSEDRQDTYMRLVEDTMKPLHILLMVGGAINAEWVDEEVSA
jgi:hypothetical protein